MGVCVTDAPRGEGWPPWVERWVVPYVDDMLLWPVAFVLLIHVVLILVPLMLSVLRTGNPGAVGAVLLAGVASAHLIRMELRAVGRPKGLTVAVALVWACSFPLAWYAEGTGVL